MISIDVIMGWWSNFLVTHATLISALASLATIVSLFVVLRGLSTDRTARNWELLRNLEERFNGESMRETRGKAAIAMQNSQEATGMLPREVTEMLNFFDLVGFMVQKKALHIHFAYDVFRDWVYFYWLYLANQGTLKNNQDTWKYVHYLHNRLLRIEIDRKRTKKERFLSLWKDVRHDSYELRSEEAGYDRKWFQEVRKAEILLSHTQVPQGRNNISKKDKE